MREGVGWREWDRGMREGIGWRDERGGDLGGEREMLAWIADSENVR